MDLSKIAASAPKQEQKSSERAFYSRFAGACTIMPNGKRLVFTNGILKTSDPTEIAHILDAYENSQEVISLVPVSVIENDALLLKEVGSKSARSTGAMNSKTIEELAANSGSVSG